MLLQYHWAIVGHVSSAALVFTSRSAWTGKGKPLPVRVGSSRRNVLSLYCVCGTTLQWVYYKSATNHLRPHTAVMAIHRHFILLNSLPHTEGVKKSDDSILARWSRYYNHRRWRSSTYNVHNSTSASLPRCLGWRFPPPIHRFDLPTSVISDIPVNSALLRYRLLVTNPNHTILNSDWQNFWCVCYSTEDTGKY